MKQLQYNTWFIKSLISRLLITYGSGFLIYLEELRIQSMENKFSNFQQKIMDSLFPLITSHTLISSQNSS